MNALEILRGARGLLDGGKNWVKGNYESHGRFCAIGAVNKASFGHELGHSSDYVRLPRAEQGRIQAERTKAITTLGEAMALKHYDEGGIIAWNDLGGRTASEVVAAFDRAIEKLELEEPLPVLPEGNPF